MALKPPSTNTSISTNRLEPFKGKPSDMTDEQYEIAKETAIKIGACMPRQMADSAFYFYYMQASWDEIAHKFNVPVGLVLYTAIFYNWEKNKELVSSVRAGTKVVRADAAFIDVITDAVVATSVVYKQQLAEVMKNPAEAAKCNLIPKNFKELSVLLQMLQQLQTKDVETVSKQGGPQINVNIANLQGNGQPQAAVQSSHQYQAIDVESEAATEQDRMDILKILEKARHQ